MEGATAALALAQIYGIGLGLAGVRLTRPLALLGVVAAVAAGVLLAVPARRGRVDPPRLEHRASRPARLLGGLLALGLFLWTAWIAAQLGALAWYREPIRWDELWYHVPAIHEWARHGGVFFYPLDPRLAAAPGEGLFAGWLNFPMGVELLALLGFFAIGTDRLIDATNLLYWPLGIAAVAVIAGRLGARGGWPWVAGALLFGASGFLSGSASIYVDAAFACTVMASLAAGVAFLVDRDRPAWRKAALLGAALGLMAGSKGTGAPFAAVIVGITLATALWRDGLGTWAVQLRGLAIAVVAAVAVGGYWSIRNLVNTGNPIYPIQLSIGQKVLAPGYDASAIGAASWTLAETPAVEPYPPWARLFAAWAQPDLEFRNPGTPGAIRHATAAGLGYLWLAGGIPAIGLAWLLAIRRRQRELLWVLGYLSLTTVGLLMVLPIAHQARFMLWLHGLGLPALALVVSEAVSRLPQNRWHLATLAAGAVAVGLAFWESARTIDLEWQLARQPTRAGVEPRFFTGLDLEWPWMPATPGFRDALAADRIARGPWRAPGAELLNGVLALPIGKREIAVLPPDPTPAEVERLAVRGFRWVLWHAASGQDLPAALARRASRTFRHDAGETTYVAVELRSAVGAGP